MRVRYLPLLAAMLGVHAIAQTQISDNAFLGGDVVYGTDDRKEPFQVQDARLREYSKSVVALVRHGSLSWEKEVGTIVGPTHRESMNLSEREPFGDQPTAAFCSGSLVGPDLVLTAGHCVKDLEECQETSFVFGFEVEESTKKARTVFSKNDVYDCGAVVSQSFSPDEVIDYALVRLDRPVTGRKPLEREFDDNRLKLHTKS